MCINFGRCCRRTSQTVSVLVVLLCLLFLNLSIFHQQQAQFSSLGPGPWAETEIPNIVHYIHILPPATPNKTQALEFEFRQFLSFYSSYIYLQPDKIFVHTNAPIEAIQRAKRSTNQWTYVVANLPGLEFRHVEAPTNTTSGLPLRELAHQGDFVRTEVLKRWGGIYMDEDIYVLKDLSDLRYSGFHNVVGKEWHGLINNGMILSVPESELITAFNALQDRVFDGGWSTHGVELLSRIVSQFAMREYQVLILEQSAFFPLDWDKGIDVLYKMHEDDGGPEPETPLENADPFNVTTFIQSFQYGKPRASWHYDWRTSYAVHGWNHNLWETRNLFGKYGRGVRGITLGYVLERNSNFARAVYPAVKHALENGVIKISSL